jgi:predicted DNA-binding transcriptional regulator AlpA
MGEIAQQGAFDWTKEQESQRGDRVEPEERSSAPPAKGGGGARSAASETATRSSRPRPAEEPAPAPLPPDGELWDVHAAARFLKRSVSWVYHKAEDGTLPVKRLGGWGLRFVPGELRAWVEKGAAAKRG